jgi:hypothetical protein
MRFDLSTEDFVLPKNWKRLSEDEHKKWISSYFMPKTKIPEPIVHKTEKITEGKLRLASGATIRFPIERAIASRNNPNIVRECEFWVDKWLITIFHDKRFPVRRFVGISNPHFGKWIAQELSFEVWSSLFKNLLRIGNKYGFSGRKRHKSLRKKRDFPLSLRDNIERERK